LNYVLARLRADPLVLYLSFITAARTTITYLTISARFVIVSCSTRPTLNWWHEEVLEV